ncbi:MAG: tRNA lysidine(34) synthetase TilS [Gemmatimonadaceae bacterium]
MGAPTTTSRIQQAVFAGTPDERAVFAVSGGIDSMVMLHAAAAVLPTRQMVVATFDHGSGLHAVAAADLVERVAMSYGVTVTIGRAGPVDRPSEASWREARLAFLRAAAMEFSGTISMAHTRDDQVETVLFRELRGAGTRGLAGLAAPGSIRRPLLPFGRADIADYALRAGVEWVDDPTNLDRGHARNRLRHELLPALRAVSPSIERDLVAIGEEAARWRADLDRAIDERIVFSIGQGGVLDVSRETLDGYSDDALGIIWPALLGRVGLAADWRGTRRLVAFTNKGSTGQQIQLSGGWTVHRKRRGFEVRRDGRGLATAGGAGISFRR